MTQDKNIQQRDLHVLFLPAWLPTTENKAAGSFILNQAMAVRNTGGCQVGVIFRDHAAVLEGVAATLDQNGIAHVIVKDIYLPKINRGAIRIWCNRYVKVYKQYEQQFGRPDLIHAHSYVAAIAAEAISAKCDVPYIITEHSTDYMQGKTRAVFKDVMRAAFENASAIIGVGAALCRAIRNKCNRDALCIANPVDDAVFYYDPKASLSETFTAVVTGSLIPRKRVDLLLLSMAGMPDANWQLICIGIGPEENTLKRLARQLGISARVEWPGYQDQKSIGSLLRQSHVLISLSQTETFGLAAAEALMCGVPVICTASGGPEDFVNDKSGIVLDTEPTPEIVMDAVVSVRSQPGEYDRQAIADRAADLFGYDQVINQVIACYQHVLAKS